MDTQQRIGTVVRVERLKVVPRLENGRGTSDNAAPGGGGGWYVGYSGYFSGGGGGSGFIYTETTAANYPAGCLLDGNYYLVGGTIQGGWENFPSPGGVPAVRT